MGSCSHASIGLGVTGSDSNSDYIVFIDGDFEGTAAGGVLALVYFHFDRLRLSWIFLTVRAR